MSTFTWDHVHLRSPDPEATAAWFERMLGAEVIRSMQQGAAAHRSQARRRQCLHRAGQAGRRRQRAADDALSGPRSPRADLQRNRRHCRRSQGQGRRIHARADHGAAGRAGLLHPRPAGHFDRASGAQARLRLNRQRRSPPQTVAARVPRTRPCSPGDARCAFPASRHARPAR